jgi:hypothetical protein
MEHLVVPANNNNESTNHAGERVDQYLLFIGCIDVREVAHSDSVVREPIGAGTPLMHRVHCSVDRLHG